MGGGGDVEGGLSSQEQEIYIGINFAASVQRKEGSLTRSEESGKMP